MAGLNDPVVLVVMSRQQHHVLVGEVTQRMGELTSDPQVTTNQIWGVPFEVSDLWVGKGPLLLRASQVDEYREGRRRLGQRATPALRT